MNFLKFKEDICLICLEYDINLNWNDEIIKSCGASYKECYYKYTQLEEIDSDFCPQNLCEQCANALKNAHLLFEKAVESYNIFQNTAKFKSSYKNSYNGSQDIDQVCKSNENDFIEYPTDEVSPLPDVLGERIEDTEYGIEEVYINDINIKNFKSFDNQLKEEPANICDINLQKLSAKKNIYDITKCELKLIKSTDEIVKNTRKYLNNQENQSRSRKSLTGKIVQRNRKSSIRNSLTKTKSKKSHAENFFNKDTKNTSLTESNTSSPFSKFTKSQKSSLTKKHNSSEKSENSITVVFVKNETPMKQSQNSSLEINFDEFDKFVTAPLTANINKSKDSQICETNEDFHEEQADTSVTAPLSIKSNERRGSEKCGTNEGFDEEQVDTFVEEENNSKISFLEEIKSTDEKQSCPKAKRVKRYNLCQYCPYKTVDITRLSHHEDRHVRNRERNVICSICGIKLYTKVSLRHHMETHDENRIKKHKCEFCEKAFFNKGALNVHRRIHLGLMLKCPICQKEYFRQLDLDRHLVHHSVVPQRDNIEKKKYVVECQYCKKSVLTYKLKEHMAVHSDKPQAKCKICEKDFFTRTRCTSHLRRFHKIKGDEYKNYIHSYIKSNSRTCFLKTRQERQVQLVTK